MFTGLEDAAGGKVVEAAGDIGQTVGDDFVVAPAIAGVDAVTRIEGAEHFQRRIGVVEEFDENLAQVRRFGPWP